MPNESRQDAAYRRLVPGKRLCLKEYRTVIAILEKELEDDIDRSTNFVINKNHNPAFDKLICGFYQQEICTLKATVHSQSTFVYHICIFCWNLLSKKSLHPAARCELFKKLDDEFGF